MQTVLFYYILYCFTALLKVKQKNIKKDYILLQTAKLNTYSNIYTKIEKIIYDY